MIVTFVNLYKNKYDVEAQITIENIIDLTIGDVVAVLVQRPCSLPISLNENYMFVYAEITEINCDIYTATLYHFVHYAPMQSAYVTYTATFTAANICAIYKKTIDLTTSFPKITYNEYEKITGLLAKSVLQ